MSRARAAIRASDRLRDSLTVRQAIDAGSDRGDERDQCDHDQRGPMALHRIRNSTEASTTTSTGAPFSRAGANRHRRTACTARSFRPEPKSLQNLDVAHRAVAADDDLHHDFALDASPSRFLCVDPA